MEAKTYTPAQFAKKYKLGRSTVWRWITNKRLTRRFKMYDANLITVAGKTFITVGNEITR